jgi:hypothetical protein
MSVAGTMSRTKTLAGQVAELRRIVHNVAAVASVADRHTVAQPPLPEGVNVLPWRHKVVDPTEVRAIVEHKPDVAMSNLVGGIIFGDQDRHNSLWDYFNFPHRTFFVGGDRGNDFYGLGGDDVFFGGAGVDTYHYMSWSDSVKGHADQIFGFDFFTDKINFTGITGPGQSLFWYVDPYMTADSPLVFGGPEPVFHLIISDSQDFPAGHTIDIDIFPAPTVYSQSQFADLTLPEQGAYLEKNHGWLITQ